MTLLFRLIALMGNRDLQSEQPCWAGGWWRRPRPGSAHWEELPSASAKTVVSWEKMNVPEAACGSKVAGTLDGVSREGVAGGKKRLGKAICDHNVKTS